MRESYQRQDAKSTGRPHAHTSDPTAVPGARSDSRRRRADIRRVPRRLFEVGAGWNIPDHGHRNVSHGCVNMNPDHAQWLFNTFTIGDVVEVRNTPVPLPVWDGIGDWAVPWSQYGH